MPGDYVEIARSLLRPVLEDAGKNSDDLSGYQQCRRILGNIVATIRSDLQNETFQDVKEEIFFYKEQVPEIWGLYHYYYELIKIVSARNFQSKEAFRSELERKLAEAEQFPQKNRAICAYYYEGRTEDDLRLFTRQGAAGAGTAMELYIDRDFTPGAYRLSQMRANEKLREWLIHELKDTVTSDDTPDLTWSIGVTDVIELFKGLHLIGCFGAATFKQVMIWVQARLGVDTRNYKINLDHIRKRKISETRFIDRIRRAFKNVGEDTS